MDGISTRLMIAAILYSVACAFPFGAGTVVVLATPSLAQMAGVLLPYIAAESLVIGAALAWHVAPIAAIRRRERPALISSCGSRRSQSAQGSILPCHRHPWRHIG